MGQPVLIWEYFRLFLRLSARDRPRWRTKCLESRQPNQPTIQPFDPQALDGIERAILKADLGFSPVNDGKILRVPIPELTEERRREFVKQVKRMSEEHKVGVRNARRDAFSILKELEKDKSISQDESTRTQKHVQELTEDFSKQIEEASTAKEREILRI